MQIRIIPVVIIISFVSGCFVGGGGAPKLPKKVIIPAGTNEPSLGLTIDASYDERLDKLVPGFKIVTVACTNTAMNIFAFDILEDKWWVEDASGRKFRAVIDLRRYAPKVWDKLTPRVKELIEYPLNLKIGETRVIDLFVRDSADLRGFRSVIFFSAFKGQTFQILARQ